MIWLFAIAGVSTFLVAGTFFAFSTFVMPALGKLDDADAARAMDRINAVIVRSPWIVIFLAAAGLAAVIAVVSLGRRVGWDAALVASLGFLLGTFGVTVSFNVPLNDALAKGEIGWSEYRRRWTAWNHARTVAATISGMAYAIAWSKT